MKPQTAMQRALDILEVPTNESAPAEAATSDRRSENVTKDSIPRFPAENQDKKSELAACKSTKELLNAYSAGKGRNGC